MPVPSLGLRLNSSHFPSGYEAISYGRGTWLFHMLRHMLLDAESKSAGKGPAPARTEEPFVRALRKLRERYAGKDISTQELLAVFEEDLPSSLWYERRKSLDWFMESWVQGTSVPHFDVRNVKYTPKTGGVSVSGLVVQKEAPPDLVTAVPIYTILGGKQILLGRVFVDASELRFI